MEFFKIFINGLLFWNSFYTTFVKNIKKIVYFIVSVKKKNPKNQFLFLFLSVLIKNIKNIS